MSIICESNWVDTYWLTKVFDELLSRIFTQKVLTEVITLLLSGFCSSFTNRGRIAVIDLSTLLHCWQYNITELASSLTLDGIRNIRMT